MASREKLDMCLWNTDASSDNKVKIWQKSLKSYILTLPHPQGHEISVKCEKIHRWIYNPSLVTVSSSKLYILHFESGTELQTDGQTNWRTDRGLHYKMPPADRSGQGHNYIISKPTYLNKLCKAYKMIICISCFWPFWLKTCFNKYSGIET